MKTRNLGKTTLSVSEYCLGAMYFGWNEPKEHSIERLNQFVEAGGNFIDTANIYAEHWRTDKDFYGKDIDQFVDGGSERLIGTWLKDKGNRHDLIIATKLGFPYPRVPYGTGAARIKEECDKSLKRLGTDYIDLLYLHTDDRDTPLEESLGALNDLVTAGKVRYIGASNFTAWRLAQAVDTSRMLGFAQYYCVQQRHSYLRAKTGWNFGGQVAANEDLLDFVRDNGMTLLAYSPLLGGYYNNRSKKLMDQYAGPDTERRLAALDEVSRETGFTPVQLVYYWMMHSDPSVLPLVAASSAVQLEEALGTLRLILTGEQMERLNRAGF